MANYELDRPVPPNLPLAPDAYGMRYQDQLNNVQRLYYNRLNEAFNQLLASAGGKFLSFPFGSFHDVLDQTAANTTTAYAIKFRTTAISNEISIASDSRITVAQYGVYNIQFSIQFVNSDSVIQDVDIWFRKNGTDLDDSNSRFSVPNKHGAVNGHLIAALNFFVDLDPGDYIEIMWCTTNVAVTIEHLNAASSPTRPVTPSAIATVSFVSRPL